MDPAVQKPEVVEDVIDQRLYMQGLERSMDVLQSFDGGREMLTLAEISERSKVGRSAAQRIVYTLAQLGYLRRDPVNQRFGLTYRMVELCSALVGEHSAAPQIQEIIRVLADETGESVAWVGRDADSIVILRSVRSKHFSHVSLPVGKRFGILPSASGQVFLAHADRADALDMFAHAPLGATARLGLHDFDSYARLLDLVLERGYALTEKDEDTYSVSMSVPVFGADRRVRGTINVSALQSRVPRVEAATRLLPAIRRAVTKMEQVIAN